MKRAAPPLIVSLLLAASALAQSPFSVSAALTEREAGTRRLAVTLAIPEHHYIYAASLEIAAPQGVAFTPLDIPAPEWKHDPFQEGRVGVYTRDTVLAYSLPAAPDFPLNVTVRFQGCNQTTCFLPESHEFALNPAGALNPQAESLGPQSAAAPSESRRFTVAARAAGYLSPAAFLAFLDRAESGAAEPGPRAAFDKKGLWLTIALIVLGGLALNLTPCVLPMIPVNIAVIGAGVAAGSRRRGFALGAAYGGGIAIVYGVLGLAVVLTGATFGALNASPWFNLGIGVLFAILALAMFDVFTIDLSRFQTRVGPGANRRKGSFAAAVGLGGVAALLAGACVAPVVISVLLLSADLYAHGHPAGLALPFLLGLGMALPWPFAGAGLSFLPRPGQWMQRIKTVFGITIFLFASWYLVLGIRLLGARMESSRTAVIEAQSEHIEEGWLTSLPEALDQAAREDKPVFVDFWASWCKNCLHMDKTTFKDPDVQRRLDRYIKVKFRAENPSAPGIKPVLNRFGVLGLPTYVVLNPGAEE